MATTCYFEGPARDVGGNGEVELEFGTSTYYSTTTGPGIYITTKEGGVILGSDQAKDFFEAVERVRVYLGIEVV